MEKRPAVKTMIMAVESDEEARTLIHAELSKRYGDDYEIACAAAPTTALEQLAQMSAAGQDVAVILADCWLDGMEGAAFLQKARALFPFSQRGLLVSMGDREAGQQVLQATAMGTIDAYGSRPWGPADEGFHHFVTRFLQEWSQENRAQFEMVRIVGDRWTPRGHELRDLFERNSIPYGFYDKSSEAGRHLLEAAGVDAASAELPLLFIAGGQTLANPSNVELSHALDVSTMYDLSEVPYDKLVDVVIIGAGPAGLSAAVYAASEGLHTVVVEREAIGGQAGQSSRIRNYLGFPVGIPGDELAARAYQQAWLFGADFTFSDEVVGLEVCDGERVVQLSNGHAVHTRTVVLTMGVAYRHLEIPALERLIGAGVFYGATSAEAQAMKGKHVYLVGGGNSAGQAVTHLARYAEHVTMLVRDSSLAISMSDYLIKEIDRCENVDIQFNTEVVGGGGEQHLEYLTLQNNDTDETWTVPTTALFVLIGAVPHTAWLPPEIKCVGRGYIVTGQDLLDDDGQPPAGWPLRRLPLPLETSVPGVFAAGDVRHRAIRRVASAVGEGSITVQHIHQYLSE